MFELFVRLLVCGGVRWGLGGRAESEEIRASHILVKHRGSRRPSSWKTVREGRNCCCERIGCVGDVWRFCVNLQEAITITREEAIARLQGNGNALGGGEI